MTRHGRQQLGLVVGALMARIDALERRAATAEGRERELREQVQALRGSLHQLWPRFEAVERQRFLPAPPMPRSELLERVPVAVAAERLGVDSETVKRWIAAGALEGEAVRLPGRTYRRWSVYARSLDALAAETADSEASNVGFTGALKG